MSFSSLQKSARFWIKMTLSRGLLIDGKRRTDNIDRYNILTIVARWLQARCTSCNRILQVWTDKRKTKNQFLKFRADVSSLNV